MLSTQLWVSLLLVLWTYFLWTRRRFYQLMLKLPGLIGYPIIGSLHMLWSKNPFLIDLGKEIEKWGTTWLAWFGPVPVLVVSDPQITQELLTSPNALSKAPVAYTVLAEILGDGVIVLNDALWSKHRKALNPAFGHNVLLSFLPVFNTESAALIVELDTLVGKRERNLLPLFKNYSLRTATQTTMGSDVKKDKSYLDNSMVNSYQCIFETGTKLVRSPWLNNKLMRQLTGIERLLKEANVTIRTLIKKLIDRKLNAATANEEMIAPTENKSNIFINLAIDQLKNQVFNYHDVEDECHTIVTAAFETTAITIAYTLMQLAMFPEYQEKVFEEIKTAFPNTGDFDVSYEDIQKLEYLDMVLNESMRLMPAVPLIVRQLTQDVTLSTGVQLPKDLQIAVSIFHIHRSQEIWGSDAETFNPEHFMPHNMQDRHSYCFIPFLKGKRNCLGWKYGIISMKVTLIKLLRNFKFSTSSRLEDLSIDNNISLKFKEVPGLKVERRA